MDRQNNNYDVIIIGSGMSALSCASILSQMYKKRVLVLEQHGKIGGFTHTFKRKSKYEWDVGLHYVGGMRKGEITRAVFDYITQGRLKWQKMPDPYDVFVYPGLTFAAREGEENLQNDLIKEFPVEEKVYGLKNSTFNAYQILQFRKAAGDDFVIYNGPDEQYLAGRLMGADGGIGGSYGVMPELYAAMERAIQKTDIKTAQRLQGAVDHIISQMYSLSSFCGAAKEIIKIRFADIGAPRLPQAPLTDQDRKKAREIAEEIGELVCSE